MPATPGRTPGRVGPTTKVERPTPGAAPTWRAGRTAEPAPGPELRAQRSAWGPTQLGRQSAGYAAPRAGTAARRTRGLRPGRAPPALVEVAIRRVPDGLDRSRRAGGRPRPARRARQRQVHPRSPAPTTPPEPFAAALALDR